MEKIMDRATHDFFSRSCVSRGNDLDTSSSNKQYVVDTISSELVDEVLSYLNSEARTDNMRSELNKQFVKSKSAAMSFDSKKKVLPSATFNHDDFHSSMMFSDESLVKPRLKRNSNSDVQLPVMLPRLVEPKSIEPSSVEPHVIIDKVSYACIEQRKELDFISILDIISDCIAYPFQRMSIEAYITTFYLKENKCPPQESIDKIISVFSIIDSAINFISSLFTQFSTLSIMQNIISPTIKMLVDSYSGREVNKEDEFFLIQNIAGFSKSMFELTPIDSTGKKPTSPRIPNGVLIKNDKLSINVNDAVLELNMKGDNLYVKDGISIHGVKYNEELGVWEMKNGEDENYLSSSKLIEDDNQDQLFVDCYNRPVRGVTMGIICSRMASNTNSNDEQTSSSRSSISGQESINEPEHRIFFSKKENEIINNFSVSVTTGDVNVKRFIFNDWVFYRIRKDNRTRAEYYHAIEINGKLVPFRVRKLNNNVLLCEIYNPNNKNISYVAEFYNGEWFFESESSHSASKQVNDIFRYYKSNVRDHEALNKTLSSADSKGLKFDAEGNAYLKIENEFIKINFVDNEMVVMGKNGDNYYLFYDENERKIKLNRVSIERGKLTVTADEFDNDNKMQSKNGLFGKSNHKINNNWEVLESNVNSFSSIDNQSLKSKIEVKLKMKYDPGTDEQFHEIPPLNWGEKIKCNDNGNVWEFTADMYSHNKNSKTFLPWNQRYVAAYDYIKAKSKTEEKWMIRMHDTNMNEISPDALSDELEPFGKEFEIKKYLKRNGGIIEVKIIDRPAIELENAGVNKERVVNFDIGFDNHTLLQFNQGIVVENEKPLVAFVTTSNNINIATAPVNGVPPENVSRPRTI